MTPAERIDKVIEELWSPFTADARVGMWLMLDGARNRRIHQLVKNSHSESACLYAGELPLELQVAAPYLLRVSRFSQFTRELIERSWGNCWGVFFASTAPLEQLRTHLRKFLRVQDQRGRRLLFRYYDPRVLRVFIPTCNAAELQQLYGPIDTFIAEGDEGNSMLRFRRAEGKLHKSVVQIGRVTTDAGA